MNISLKDKIAKLLQTNSDINPEAIGRTMLNPGASASEIQTVKTYFEDLLPQDYIDFLIYTNGADFFNYDNLDGFRFFNSISIVKQNAFQKENYAEYWQDNIILFCDCIGEGNFLGFRILDDGTYQILDCFHEQIPDEWKPFGTSFDFFLEELIDRKGSKYWLDQT